MPRDSSPTIKEFKVRAVRVPMTEAHQTASGVITESPRGGLGRRRGAPLYSLTAHCSRTSGIDHGLGLR